MMSEWETLLHLFILSPGWQSRVSLIINLLNKKANTQIIILNAATASSGQNV